MRVYHPVTAEISAVTCYMKYMALWDLIMTVSSKTMANNLGFGFYYY